MADVRGHALDSDRWASFGLDQWSCARVLRYFRRSEIWQGGASTYCSGDGPLKAMFTPWGNPFNEA